MLRDWESFLALEAEWNALVAATGDQPFYRHEYVRTWIECFAPGAALRLLFARDAAGRLAAVLPLLARRGRLLGLPMREWGSPTDVHSFRFDLVARDPGAAARAFLPWLRATRGWRVLRIADVPAGGAAWELYRVARASGLAGGVYCAQRSPYLELPASMAALRATWTSKWRSNLARRHRLLAARGQVTTRRCGPGEDLAARLEECFAIEQSGWKGRRGEPANGDPRIRNFYLTLARRTARDGSFSLDLLELDGRPVAFHYGLTRAGIYSLLLTSYDETLREASPGHLLTEAVVERSIALGVREFDFLGCDLEWKRAWTTASREHSWIYLFRGAAGALLARAKFDLAPAARRLLSRRSRPSGSPARSGPEPSHG